MGYWSLPVKLERVKATLRTHCQVQDMRAALISQVTLPNEIVDMIMDYIFEPLHARLLEQWSTIYLCTIDPWDPSPQSLVDQELHCTLGTVYRRICEQFDPEALVPGRNAQLNTCTTCRALRSESAKDNTHRYCTACQAVVDQTYEPTQGRPWNSNGYEASLVDLGNAHDNHPNSLALFFQYLLGNSPVWRMATTSIAKEWQTALHDGFFTQQEVDILASVGFECQPGPLNSCPDGHTYAYLVALPTIENLPVAKGLGRSAPKGLQQTMDRAMKRLRLHSCCFKQHEERYKIVLLAEQEDQEDDMDGLSSSNDEDPGNGPDEIDIPDESDNDGSGDAVANTTTADASR